MPLNVSAKTSSFVPAPEGLHPAVCIGVYDLGTHFDERWSKTNPLIMIHWELPDTMGGDKKTPMTVQRRYTRSLHKKANLRHDLQSWRGRAFTDDELERFDILKVLGTPCQLQVQHTNVNGTVYANVMNVVPFPKGLTVPKPVHALLSFSFEDAQNGEAPPIPAGAPSWVRDLIQKSNEWRGVTEAHGQDDGQDSSEPDDSIPF